MSGGAPGMNKQQALETIRQLMSAHQLTVSDIAPQASVAEKASGSGTLMRMFSYIGGILIIAGICYYTASFWASFNSYVRVLITFGPGFICMLLGLIAQHDPRYTRAAGPLYILAALLQPSGIAVTLMEFFTGDNPHSAVLLITGTLAVQFGVAFYYWRHEMLLLLFGVFFTSAVVTVLDWIDIKDRYVAFITGLSMLLIAYGFKEYRLYRRTIDLANLIGSVLLLWAFYDIVERTFVEITFVLVAAGVMYVSTLVESRGMLIVGALALFSYISYYSEKYISNSVGWALTLIILGIIFIMMGGLVVRISRRFGKQQS